MRREFRLGSELQSASLWPPLLSAATQSPGDIGHQGNEGNRGAVDLRCLRLLGVEIRVELSHFGLQQWG